VISTNGVIFHLVVYCFTSMLSRFSQNIPLVLAVCAPNTERVKLFKNRVFCRLGESLLVVKRQVV
jgi:hypothetical protein